MRDYLDGFAQVGAFAFAGDDGVVYPSRGYVVGLGGMHAQETLVVSQVQVCFRSVFRDVALSVLVRVEGSGVYIDVGVEFLDGDSEAPGLQEFRQRRSNNALPERGRNSA